MISMIKRWMIINVQHLGIMHALWVFFKIRSPYKYFRMLTIVYRYTCTWMCSSLTYKNGQLLFSQRVRFTTWFLSRIWNLISPCWKIKQFIFITRVVIKVKTLLRLIYLKLYCFPHKYIWYKHMIHSNVGYFLLTTTCIVLLK